MQCWKQRAGLNLEGSLRNLTDPPGNSEAVHLFEGKRLQDHEVKRPLQKIRLFWIQGYLRIEVLLEE
jgi:hypothetical protein